MVPGLFREKQILYVKCLEILKPSHPNSRLKNQARVVVKTEKSRRMNIRLNPTYSVAMRQNGGLAANPLRFTELGGRFNDYLLVGE